MEKSLSATALHGGKWLGISALAQALLKIVVVAVLARLLTPTEFGLVAIAGIFIDVAAGIAAMGVSQALVQQRDLMGHHIRAAFWIALVTGVAMTALLYFTSGWLAQLLRGPEAAPLIAALSGVFVIQALGVVPEGLATRNRDFRLLAVRQFVAYVLGYGVVGIGSAVLGAGAWALIYAQITQTVLATLLLIMAVRFDWRPTATWSAYREIFTYGSGVSVARIATSFANQMDRVIVSINTSPASVGLYTKAVQVTRYPNMLVGKVIEDVLFPSFANVQADRERLKNAYCRSVGAICVVMMPVSVFFCLSAGPIADLLLGPQWDGVVPLMMVLSVSLTFRLVQRISNALMFAIGRSWLIATWQVVLFVTTTGGALVGIRFGLVGAVIGVTIAYTVCYIAGTVVSALLLSLSVSRLMVRYLTGLPLSVLAAIGVAAGNSLVVAEFVPSLVGLAISVLLAVVLALVAIRFAPRLFLQEDGQWLFSLLLSKLPQRLSAFPILRR
ncbi:lipopolysaccharide biosynthesis protein [Mycobacterium sp. pW049]|uniref:lipopolysaccharide biosynthesis protein n=1 Tax=[Mycobacterium] bulgaricum TaxID=3238985 RepID=UPI00351BAE0F